MKMYNEQVTYYLRRPCIYNALDAFKKSRIRGLKQLTILLRSIYIRIMYTSVISKSMYGVYFVYITEFSDAV